MGRLHAKLIRAIADVFKSTELGMDEASGVDRIEPWYLTREERIIDHLDSVDGYAWQGEIVSHLEWSEATTSRTLSSMEETASITRYRIGRRKIVCLPEHEPGVLQSKNPSSLDPRQRPGSPQSSQVATN